MKALWRGVACFCNTHTISHCCHILLLFFVSQYLPELTEDENELNELTKTFSVIPFGSIILFIFLVLGIGTALGVKDDEVMTGRIAAIASFFLLLILYSISWGKLFEQRPALNTLKEGQSLWTAGFTQIYNTSKKIYNNYSALTWFYVAVAFGDPKPLTAIAITFFTDQLQFTPTENGIAAIVMLIASIPGAVLSSWFTRRFNPILSSVVSMILMLIATTMAAIILKGPGQQIACFVIVAGWGIGGGWKHTATRMLASSIIPEGQDAELMVRTFRSIAINLSTETQAHDLYFLCYFQGFYLFADQLLSWLPPLIFTALNEAGYSQRIGITTLNFFFFIALIAYCKMGNYQTAVRAAGRVVDESQEDLKPNNDDVAEEDSTREPTSCEIIDQSLPITKSVTSTNV